MSYEPHYRQTFGGIDKHVEDPSVPGDYRETVGATRGRSVEFPSFHEVLSTLRDEFGVESRNAYYYDHDRDEYVQVPNRVVLVNPAWLGDGLDEAPQNSAGWTTASDSYSETDAMDNYGPLVALARQRGFDDVFGNVWAYRNGGDVRLDLFFNGLTADDPADDEPRYVLGFETGYDYFRSQSVNAAIIAYDTETGSVMRGLSDAYSSPHRGDIEGRTVSWFETMLDRAEKVGDTLYQVVAEARNYEVELSTLPLTVEGFYEALGFPGPSVAEPAAAMVSNTRNPTAWDLYEPLTLVLSREYGGKVGGDALVNHASRANDLLYSPASTERKAYRQAAEALDGQATLPGVGDDDAEDAAEVLMNRAGSLDEAVEKSVSFRERIRTMLAEDVAGDEDDEDDEQDEADEAEVAA